MSDDNVDVHENVSERTQATDPRFNMEPALVEVPGTPYAREMAKFERPYRYQPFPRMLYKAERFKGTIMCGAPEPMPWEFQTERAYLSALEEARRYTEKCQTIVGNESERTRHMDMGWRESPAEAVAFVDAREKAESKEIAHRNWDDRNLSENAKAEAAAQEAAAGVPLPEIAEARRGPGRPRKNATA